MANQDLLFSILPRPPLAPGSGESHRDVRPIEKEPVTPKTEIHKDPSGRSPQDEYHPRHPQDLATEEEVPAEGDDQDIALHGGEPETGNEHVDLFV